MRCFIRAACSIEFDDKVVVTGGWADGCTLDSGGFAQANFGKEGRR